MLSYKTLLLLFLGINCITFAMHKNGLSKTSSFKENPATQPDIKEECVIKLQQYITALSEDLKRNNIKNEAKNKLISKL